jgi:NADH dehydrogenase
VGSVIKQPQPEQGGIPLLDLNTAMKIREKWRANLIEAKKQADPLQRKQRMTIAIAGAGISGIETSAELASAIREDAKRIGLNPSNIKIYLFNAHSRLFPEGPAKVGKKLEQLLESAGVTIFHNSKVLQEKNGLLSLDNGKRIPVGLCIWTNPLLRQIGLPLTPKGYVVVDHSYRVKGTTGIYSIGDCAQITDPTTGRSDGKTCKEASAQAIRLGKIIAADLKGKSAPIHKEYIDFFCFGLGPKQGIVWTRLLGQDIILAGKLGWQIRKFTWDLASLLK